MLVWDHGGVHDASHSGLIGREDAFAVLAGALARADGGAPGVVVVSGETGVGKTRLVSEFVRHHRPALLSGAAIPMAGEPLPFAPLVQALHRAGRSTAVRRQIDRLPELARLLPDADPPDGGPIGGSPQLRLFQAVLTLLDRLASDRPVLHVVEDVHWADVATLDLIRYLATTLMDERVLVVLTLRDDHTTPHRAWLAELLRLPVTTHLPLPRLGEADTRLLVTSTLGYPPDPTVLATIVSRSAGNPLFVEELARVADTGDAMLPSSLRDLLASRIASLPEETRQVLRAASVIGRRAPVGLLAAVLSAPAEVTERRLHPGLAHHVVELDRDDLIAFRHPAFAEVVYQSILPAERQAWHAAVARAINDDPAYAANAPGELARHWHQAGDLTRALEAALVAGYAAEQMYAFADAHANFMRADLLLDRVDSEVDRSDVRSHAAAAASLLGDGGEAVRLLESALESQLNPGRRAALLTQLGAVHFAAGRGSQAEQALRAAAALLPPDEVSLLAAQVRSWLAKLAAAWGRLAEADVEATAALTLATATGALREEGRARAALGIVAGYREDFAESVTQLREALRIAREVAAADDLVSAYINLSHVLGASGAFDESLALGREAVDVLTRMGLIRQGGGLLLANTAETLIRAGRLADADEMIETGLSLHPRGIMAAPLLLRAAELCAVRGEGDLAWERAEQARLIIEAESAPHAWRRAAAWTGALVELWQGRPDEALTQIRDGLANLHPDSPSDSLRMVSMGLAAVGELAVRDRSEDAALARGAQIEELMSHVPEGVDESADPTPLTVLRAELSRARGTSSVELWEQCRRWYAQHGWEGYAAYAGWREAEARLTRAVDADAIAVVRATHDRAVGLGLLAVAREVESLARWYRVELVPEAAARNSPDMLGSYGLTPRELEVLRGLAAGRSNQEIADDLFISVKTASVHVSNILRKLDVKDRREAARVAHLHGIRE